MSYNNGTSAHLSEYNRLYNNYIPRFGPCAADALEVFRAVSKIYFDYYREGVLPVAGWNASRHMFLFDNTEFEVILNGLFERMIGENTAFFEAHLDFIMDAAVLFAKMCEEQHFRPLPPHDFMKLLTNGMPPSP